MQLHMEIASCAGLSPEHPLPAALQPCPASPFQCSVCTCVSLYVTGYLLEYFTFIFLGLQSAGIKGVCHQL